MFPKQTDPSFNPHSQNHFGDDDFPHGNNRFDHRSTPQTPCPTVTTNQCAARHERNEIDATRDAPLTRER
jgi:hypothetical protein